MSHQVARAPILRLTPSYKEEAVAPSLALPVVEVGLRRRMLAGTTVASSIRVASRKGRVVRDGRTFDTIEEGMAFACDAGFGALAERGVAAAQEIGPDVVYAGFSFGVMIAQQLAQTRPGAVARCSCTPASRSRSSGRLAGGRPGADPRQGRRPVLPRGPRGSARARRLDQPRRAVLYPGEEHLFADSSLLGYDPAAAATLTERVLTFLDTIEARES